MREIRRIYFNAVDLTHALENFRVDRPQFLPNGRFSGIDALDEHLLLRMEMRYVDNVHVLEFKVAYDKLIDALVAYCHEHRIPVPPGSRRNLFPEAGEAVLEIAAVTDEELASRPGELTRWRDRVGT